MALDCNFSDAIPPHVYSILHFVILLEKVINSMMIIICIVRGKWNTDLPAISNNIEKSLHFHFLYFDT